MDLFGTKGDSLNAPDCHSAEGHAAAGLIEIIDNKALSRRIGNFRNRSESGLRH
jgi:hypothetical protein